MNFQRPSLGWYEDDRAWETHAQKKCMPTGVFLSVGLHEVFRGERRGGAEGQKSTPFHDSGLKESYNPT